MVSRRPGIRWRGRVRRVVGQRSARTRCGPAGIGGSEAPGGQAARGGARGRAKLSRIFATDCGAVTTARTRRCPAQFGQVLTSKAKVLLRREAQSTRGRGGVEPFPSRTLVPWTSPDDRSTAWSTWLRQELERRTRFVDRLSEASHSQRPYRRRSLLLASATSQRGGSSHAAVRTFSRTTPG